jgi:hypothetical protein
MPCKDKLGGYNILVRVRTNLNKLGHAMSGLVRLGLYRTC